MIENDEVVESLIDLYSSSYLMLKANNDDVTAYRNRFILPYIIENVDVNAALTQRDASSMKILDEVVFQNHLAYNQISLFSTQESYKRTIERLREVLALVKEEL